MAKVRFHPLLEWFTGKMGKLVFRRSHNGKVSLYEAPYMKRIKWSQAQKDHRRRLGEASKYASAAIADPEIRAFYIQMARDRDMNPERPFDMAVSDYYHHGNDLLWRKHMGEQEKPANWDMLYYPWYRTNKIRRRNRRRS